MDIPEPVSDSASAIDPTIEDLFGKLVEGSASPGDVAALRMLSAIRADRMKLAPPAPPKFHANSTKAKWDLPLALKRA